MVLSPFFIKDLVKESWFKNPAISVKLYIRLQAYQVGTNTWSGTEVNFSSSDWLMCSERNYFVRAHDRLRQRRTDFKATGG